MPKAMVTVRGLYVLARAYAFGSIAQCLRGEGKTQRHRDPQERIYPSPFRWPILVIHLQIRYKLSTLTLRRYTYRFG